VLIFQPIEITAGQKVTVSVGASVERVVKTGAGTAILSTLSTRTGGTVVEAGEIVVSHKNALGTGLLEVQAGAKAKLQVGYASVFVTSLSLADASRLELGTSKLTVAANGFTESDIRQNLITGRNGGSWDGASGITSTFAGGDRSIGYRVVNAALEVAYAAPGDGNLDGVFDILDLSEILSAGKFDTGESANWQQGDTNYDGVFDILDLSEILGTGLFNQGNYLTQGSASSAAAKTGGVVTFDPALVFAALAAEPTSQPTTKRKSF
jgi:autotransporter-associated beta strand protein